MMTKNRKRSLGRVKWPDYFGPIGRFTPPVNYGPLWGHFLCRYQTRKNDRKMTDLSFFCHFSFLMSLAYQFFIRLSDISKMSDWQKWHFCHFWQYLLTDYCQIVDLLNWIRLWDTSTFISFWSFHDIYWSFPHILIYIISLFIAMSKFAVFKIFKKNSRLWQIAQYTDSFQVNKSFL